MCEEFAPEIRIEDGAEAIEKIRQREGRLAFRQEPALRAAARERIDPAARAVNADGAELHQDLRVDLRRIAMERQLGTAELGDIVALSAVAIADLHGRCRCLPSQREGI